MGRDDELQPALPTTETRRRFLVPRSRRLTCDVLHFHRQVPLCPHHRLFHLGPLELVRKSVPTRISWPVLFLKAYGLLAREVPVFRQTWMSFPWPHIYQHETSVGMLAVQREHQGESWLFWGRFVAPEETSLLDLQKQLDAYQTAPVQQMFKQFLRLSSVPNPFRRFLWWIHMQLHGPLRARRVGTFFLSTLSSLGAEIVMPPSFQTGVVTYGPIDSHGHSRVTLAYDHRLMDGQLVANSLVRLQAILTGVLAEELQAMLPVEPAKSVESPIPPSR